MKPSKRLSDFIGGGYLRQALNRAVGDKGDVLTDEIMELISVASQKTKKRQVHP